MSITFRHATLANGLTVVGEIDPAAHTAAAGFFVRTGARDEEPARMGVSHFLEHMMFKGTATRTAEQVNNDFDAIGASNNAYTSNETTAFWAHVLPEHLPRATTILADILRPALREADFEEERQVILEEIAMYEDQPFWELYEHGLERFYGPHPLGHRVLGTKETIARLSRDEMVGYFEQRYSADNTVCAVAGRVDFDALVDQLAEACRTWQATKPQRDAGPVTACTGEFTMRRPQVGRAYIIMLAPAPAHGDDRRYAAAVLAQLLGDTDGSRFYWALVETGLAEEAHAQYSPRDGTGEYLAFLACPTETADEVEAIARREAADLARTLTSDDLVRARSRIATAVTLASERPAGRMRRLGELWNYSRAYRSLDEELARIEALTLDDLAATAEAFPIVPKVTGRLVPGDEDAIARLD
jgi:predicted Zn-dependent peptidase